MPSSPAASRSPGTGGGPIVLGRALFGIFSLLLYGASVFWYDIGEPFGPGVACTLAFGLFGLHLALGYGRLAPLDPLVWVPISILMFYFGTPVVIEWLGLPVRGGYDTWEAGNHEFMERGYCVALFSLCSLLWGMYLAGVRVLDKVPRRDVADRSLAPAALLFALGSIGMVLLGVVIVGPSTVFGLYGDWWAAKMAGADERFIDVGVIFSYAGVFALLATDEPRARWRRYLAYAFALVVVFITIQKGDRSGLVALAVGSGWVYSQRVGRVRGWMVIAAAVAGLAVMPVIGEWRAERNLAESKQSTARELLGKSLANMGSSVNAITFTVEFVPKEKDYYWGGTFRYAFLSAVPNIGLSKGKDWARGTIEDTPSNWLSAIISPTWYNNLGGHGFAMAAEWYYNFGFPGIWLGMALCGWILARARNGASQSSLGLVWSATLFAGMAIWVRNVLGAPLKIMIWPVIGLWLIDRLLRLLRARAAQPRALATGLPGGDPHAPAGS